MYVEKVILFYWLMRWEKVKSAFFFFFSLYIYIMCAYNELKKTSWYILIIYADLSFLRGEMHATDSNSEKNYKPSQRHVI